MKKIIKNLIAFVSLIIGLYLTNNTSSEWATVFIVLGAILLSNNFNDSINKKIKKLIK